LKRNTVIIHRCSASSVLSHSNATVPPDFEQPENRGHGHYYGQVATRFFYQGLANAARTQPARTIRYFLTYVHSDEFPIYFDANRLSCST
jgi:hypothetical protein